MAECAPSYVQVELGPMPEILSHRQRSYARFRNMSRRFSSISSEEERDCTSPTFRILSQMMRRNRRIPSPAQDSLRLCGLRNARRKSLALAPAISEQPDVVLNFNLKIHVNRVTWTKCLRSLQQLI